MLEVFLKRYGIEWVPRDKEEIGLDEFFKKVKVELVHHKNFSMEEQIEFFRKKVTQKGEYLVKDLDVFLKNFRIVPKEVNITSELMVIANLTFSKGMIFGSMWWNGDILGTWAAAELDLEFKEKLIENFRLKQLFNREEVEEELIENLEIYIQEFSDIMQNKTIYLGFAKKFKEEVVKLLEEERD